MPARIAELKPACFSVVVGPTRSRFIAPVSESSDTISRATAASSPARVKYTATWRTTGADVDDAADVDGGATEVAGGVVVVGGLVVVVLDEMVTVLDDGLVATPHAPATSRPAHVRRAVAYLLRGMQPWSVANACGSTAESHLVAVHRTLTVCTTRPVAPVSGEPRGRWRRW